MTFVQIANRMNYLSLKEEVLLDMGMIYGSAEYVVMGGNMLCQSIIITIDMCEKKMNAISELRNSKRLV